MKLIAEMYKADTVLMPIGGESQFVNPADAAMATLGFINEP